MRNVFFFWTITTTQQEQRFLLLQLGAVETGSIMEPKISAQLLNGFESVSIDSESMARLADKAVIQKMVSLYQECTAMGGADMYCAVGINRFTTQYFRRDTSSSARSFLEFFQMHVLSVKK